MLVQKRGHVLILIPRLASVHKAVQSPVDLSAFFIQNIDTGILINCNGKALVFNFCPGRLAPNIEFLAPFLQQAAFLNPEMPDGECRNIVYRKKNLYTRLRHLLLAVIEVFTGNHLIRPFQDFIWNFLIVLPVKHEILPRPRLLQTYRLFGHA